MKKVMLTLAGMLFVGVMAVSAQVTQDTTRTSTGTSGTGIRQGSDDEAGSSGTGQTTTGTAGTTGTPSTGSSSTTTGSSSTSNDAATSGSATTSGVGSTDAANQNRVEVQSSEIPASLRSTLQGSEYKGWEEGTVYRDKTTNEYSVEVGEGTNKKSYRFDKSGKRVAGSSAKGDQK